MGKVILLFGKKGSGSSSIVREIVDSSCVRRLSDLGASLFCEQPDGSIDFSILSSIADDDNDYILDTSDAVFAKKLLSAFDLYGNDYSCVSLEVDEFLRKNRMQLSGDSMDTILAYMEKESSEDLSLIASNKSVVANQGVSVVVSRVISAVYPLISIGVLKSVRKTVETNGHTFKLIQGTKGTIIRVFANLEPNVISDSFFMGDMSNEDAVEVEKVFTSIMASNKNHIGKYLLELFEYDLRRLPQFPKEKEVAYGC